MRSGLPLTSRGAESRSCARIAADSKWIEPNSTSLAQKSRNSTSPKSRCSAGNRAGKSAFVRAFLVVDWFAQKKARRNAGLPARLPALRGHESFNEVRVESAGHEIDRKSTRLN